MSLVVCVLLWPHPGAEDALVAYEDDVLALLADHGARVVQRARRVGAEERPFEFQIIEFPSAEAMQRYMDDKRRLAMAPRREQAVARTEVVEVQLVALPASDR